MEELLAGAVEDEHAGRLSLRAVAECVAAAEIAVEQALTEDPVAAQAAMAAALAHEERLREQIAVAGVTAPVSRWRERRSWGP
ncbi:MULTISPECIES: hypothetical protein [unclassified Streptomyces]|uniref:hypothetical protein n=1 Tax=unclassified Streptomyces TaxID=2593676 RepID=UPI0035D9B871